ncbi:uncharacterized protein B0I36DRAFT_332794 [Microdochium trichocladiopsis]|uniref:Rhodopsin domain-containing protein n=1 Tax=Microdochium trichocladiopsis TaxID=1682393 RepID=A0A9P9BQ69_9PEZI|nr:uncharacterized protein B0I36DRAFT_332794 [Microdochium trichocladiopsis]KAH7025241.1 hypothetical protein B0I36DRAFT_332794 [Microdochium trichocladiopsis]
MSAIVESFTLLSIALCTIAVRTWYRWSQVGFSGFQLDDYIMPVSGLLFSLVTTLAYLVGANYDGLTNSYMTDEQRAALDPTSKEAYNREMGSKIQVIGWSFYAMELWVLKVCITVFYSRLTTRLSNLHTRVLVGYGVIGVSYIAVGLSIVLGCQPISRNWQIHPNPGNLCQPTNSKLNVFMVYLPNVITDVYLLSIPLPLLWGVNISLRRKLTLMLLFSGAIFVIAAATIRAVVIITAGPEGAVSGSQWACREIFVSAVVSNLPVIQPLLRKLASHTGLSILFSRSGGRSGKNGAHDGASGGSGKSYPLSENPRTGPHSKSYGLGSRSKFGTQLSRHATAGPAAAGAATTTAVAAWGSDEHILLDGGGKTLSPGTGAAVMGDKDIVVGKEITVVTESAADARSGSVLGHRDKDVWGYSERRKRDSSSDRSSR